MSLFRVDSDSKNNYDVFSTSARLEAYGSFLDKYKDLQRDLTNGIFDNGNCTNIWCKGKWSLHQLVKVLLLMTGPADLFLSTWAIQETAVRELLLLKDEKIIKSIYGVFDYKIKDRKSSAFMLAEQNFNAIGLAKCHAKVTVIWNEEYRISIISSANWTRNPRWERYVILRDDAIAEGDRTVIQKIIDGSY